MQTQDGRKYTVYASGIRRRLNDNGSLYERPGKAEIKRRKKARQQRRRADAQRLQAMNAAVQRSGRGVRGVPEVTAAPDV